MAVSQSEVERHVDEGRIRDRMADIQSELNDVAEEWEFAASTDAQYRMLEARREALRMEKTKLQEILGDL